MERDGNMLPHRFLYPDEYSPLVKQFCQQLYIECKYIDVRNVTIIIAAHNFWKLSLLLIYMLPLLSTLG